MESHSRPGGCSRWLNIAAGRNRSEPALSNGAVAVPGRESVLEQLKTEYQDELSQFGLQHEPQLIRLENIVLLSTALADFSTRAHYLGRLRIHSEAIFGRDSPQAEDARLALTSSVDFESMSDEQRADLSQAARDYLDIDQLIRTHQAESARKRIESALERRTNVLGPSHPDVGKTLIDAALLIESQETNPIPTSITARLWQLTFDNQPDYFYFLREYSALLYRQADHAGAEQVLRKTQELLQRRDFQSSEMYANVLVELGTLGYMTGDYTTAKDRLLEAADLQKNLGLAGSANNATGLQTLALVLSELGELEVAKKYFDASLQIDRQRHGLNAPEYWSAKTRYAWLLYKAGEFGEAKSIAEQSLRYFDSMGDASTANRAMGLTVLGKSLQGLGELHDAESAFLAALKHTPTTKNLGRYEGVMLNNLAKSQQAARKFEEALSTIDKRSSKRDRNLIDVRIFSRNGSRLHSAPASSINSTTT